jgi:hypothetical protein
MREARPGTWAEGIEAACQHAVYVTPPVGDWTLAVGATLFPPDRADDFVKPLLERLSRQFGDVQYFCTHQDVELHIWARARKGQLLRGYGWLGQKELILWDEGRPTREERALGYWLLDGQPPPGGVRPDEAGVLQLACLWSIDPTTLDEHCKEPVMGILGAGRPDMRITR